MESSRRGGHFEYRHVHTRAIDTPSAMPVAWLNQHRCPTSRGLRHVLQRLCVYVGSMSASPTACPLRGYARAGTQNDRLGKVVILSTGASIPAQWACRRRCRALADSRLAEVASQAAAFVICFSTCVTGHVFRHVLGMRSTCVRHGILVMAY